MKKRIVRYCLAFFFMAIISGCASYYKVTDPVSNKVYYTGNIDRKLNGLIQFTDEESKTNVTLMGADVLEITKGQYKENIYPQ